MFSLISTFKNTIKPFKILDKYVFSSYIYDKKNDISSSTLTLKIDS